MNRTQGPRTTGGSEPLVIDVPGRGGSRPPAAWAMAVAAVVVGVAAVVLWVSVARSAVFRVDLEMLALALLAIAATFGGISVGSILASRPGRLVVRLTDDGALVLPGSAAQRLMYWPLVAVSTLGVPLMWRIHHLPGARVSLIQQVLLVGSTLVGPVLAVRLLRARPSEVVLRRDSVTARPAFGQEHTVGWRDLPARAPGPHPLGAMLARAGHEFPERALASDPSLVAAVVEHYRATPGDRREFANGRVLDRLWAGEI